MRFDSSEWHKHSSLDPKPVLGKSYLLMCETRGSPKPLPKIRWYRDGRELRNNKHFYIIVSKPLSPQLLSFHSVFYLLCTRSPSVESSIYMYIHLTPLFPQEDRPEWRSSYTSSTLVIMRFVPRFQGNYTCVGSNVFRMKKQTFYMQGWWI